MAHLYTDAPAPTEWLEYMLADRFHWTLAEIRATPLGAGMQLLMMMGEHGKWLKAQANK